MHVQKCRREVVEVNGRLLGACPMPETFVARAALTSAQMALLRFLPAFGLTFSRSSRTVTRTIQRSWRVQGVSSSTGLYCGSAEGTAITPSLRSRPRSSAGWGPRRGTDFGLSIFREHHPSDFDRWRRVHVPSRVCPAFEIARSPLLSPCSHACHARVGCGSSPRRSAQRFRARADRGSKRVGRPHDPKRTAQHDLALYEGACLRSPTATSGSISVPQCRRRALDESRHQVSVQGRRDRGHGRRARGRGRARVRQGHATRHVPMHGVRGPRGRNRCTASSLQAHANRRAPCRTHSKKPRPR
jgi:hypothetical protein